MYVTQTIDEQYPNSSFQFVEEEHIWKHIEKLHKQKKRFIVYKLEEIANFNFDEKS